MRLDRQLVSLLRLLADREQADGRPRPVEDLLGEGSAHHGELDEVLGTAVGVGACVDQHRDPLPGGDRHRDRRAQHAGEPPQVQQARREHGARVAGGDLNLGFDLTRMSAGERDQLMKTLAANYNINLGDLNLNANVQRPLDAKGVYVGNLSGSVPLAGGRASLGVQGVRTPYGTDVTGYNAGWQGRVGPGNLSANIMQPTRGSRSAQVQYEIPFAAGGLVNYDPNEIDTIVSKLKEEFHG